MLGAHPAVFTLTSSVTPTASPHPATRISAMVIMGLCGIAQFSDPPPHQLYLLAPSALVLVHRLLDRGPGGGLATSHKCSANPHEMLGTRLRVGHRCSGLLLGSTAPHHCWDPQHPTTTTGPLKALWLPWGRKKSLKNKLLPVICPDSGREQFKRENEKGGFLFLNLPYHPLNFCCSRTWDLLTSH